MKTSHENALHAPGAGHRRGNHDDSARPTRRATRNTRFVLVALAVLVPAALVSSPRTGEAGGGAAQPASCQGSLVVNGNFVMGNNQGTMPAPGSVAAWTLGYGAPQVFKTAGCADNGYVRLSGNKTSGNAVAQVFNPANKIKQGKKYVFSACVRNVPGAPYVKLRIVAFNGSLPSGSAHPAPGPSLAIIGHTAMIPSTNWVQTNLASWTAGKDYDGFAIAAESNDGTLAVGDIDNVCLTEVSEVNCEEAQTDANGQLVLPPNTDPNTPLVYEDVDEYEGHVSDIYPSQCGTNIDTWYQNCEPPCANLGGQVPPEANEDKCSEELEELGVMTPPPAPGQLASAMTCDKLLDTLNNFKPVRTRQAKLPPIPAATPPACPANPTPDPSQPFQGADIIYVHGLKLEHLCDRAHNVPGAQKNWPSSSSEFYSGYYKNKANESWQYHIQHFLTDRGFKNRYLVVSYNCSQPLKVAAHAVLSQIRQAMYDGTGVVTPPGVAKDCFAKKYVLISHSTGGLVSDVALAIAEQTKTQPAVSAEFGHVGYIADRARIHVAVHGSLSGSHLASAMVVASQVPGLKQLANLIVNKTQHCQSTYADVEPYVNGSILIDLVPQIAQGPSPVGWRDHVNSVPVPVLTVAGGHPGGTWEWTPLVKQGLHAGYDDGVLTMDSQCGNSNLWHTWPSRTIAVSSGLYKPRLFDLGIAFPRAVGYFVDATFFTSPSNYAAGCIPRVTPNGMVTPPATINLSANPLNRYNNHYSFIQTASGHYAGPRGLAADPYGTGANYAPPNYNYEPTLGTPNSEEVRALTSTFPYTSGLVSANMQNMVGQHVRGKKIPIPVFKGGKLTFVPKWIWKRTYHLLDGFETKTECDYVYEYVLKP